VIGTTGFGKSTLAEKLARRLGLEFVELDALRWEKNWKSAPDDVFRQRVEAATRSPAWAVAGNYSLVRDIVWPRAQAVIWLDYPFAVGLWRLVRRTVRRGIFREKLWNGTREPFIQNIKFWSDESIISWYFKTYGRRKHVYPQLLAQPEHAHLRVFHFRTPRETDAWLADLPPRENLSYG
jgi:adenylate kinase family enzyme